jgi:hypothetical protein
MHLDFGEIFNFNTGNTSDELDNAELGYAAFDEPNLIQNVYANEALTHQL